MAGDVEREEDAETGEETLTFTRPLEHLWMDIYHSFRIVLASTVY